jgi:anti-sigma factor RsiW
VARGLRQWLTFVRDHRWAPGRISPYLEGELDPAGRARIERHTRDCPECDELLRQLTTMVAALGRMRGSAGPDVAVAVLARVHERLDEEQGA